MAKLKDVAEECGLTVTTVSRVLNNRGYISDETRQKVQEAMKKLNYQPNEVARSLSKQSTSTIGVIVPHIRHPYFTEMISFLEAAAARKGYKIILCNSKGKNEREQEYLKMCSSNRVAGVILFSAGVDISELAGNHIPVVTVERFLEDGTASIECDNVDGGRLAAQGLIGKGCKKLLYISGVQESTMPADDRGKGFYGECKKHGVEAVEILTTIEQYDSGEYRSLLTSALQDNPDIDGCFTSSDLIAAQLIQVATRMGRSVPEDLKIVGFDDTYFAEMVTPMLTTIHQPIKEMATAAVELLIAASKGETVARRTMLPVCLVQREST